MPHIFYLFTSTAIYWQLLKDMQYLNTIIFICISLFISLFINTLIFMYLNILFAYFYFYLNTLNCEKSVLLLRC